MIRLNDRRILFGMLKAAGVPETDYDRALITLDKLDKIGVDGVTAELAEYAPEAAAAIGADLAKLDPAGQPLEVAAMLEVLPTDIDREPVTELAALAATVADGIPAGVTLVFDPTLVRGMGYYTGTIFEIAHPSSGSSVGGGGRYDGMIGRFLAQSVPAVGSSIGFERIIDLVELDETRTQRAVALLWDDATDTAELLRTKRELIADGARVQLAKRRKNMKQLFSYLKTEGFTHVMNVGETPRELN